MPVGIHDGDDDRDGAGVRERVPAGDLAVPAAVRRVLHGHLRGRAVAPVDRRGVVLDPPDELGRAEDLGLDHLVGLAGGEVAEIEVELDVGGLAAEVRLEPPLEQARAELGALQHLHRDLLSRCTRAERGVPLRLLGGGRRAAEQILVERGDEARIRPAAAVRVVLLGAEDRGHDVLVRRVAGEHRQGRCELGRRGRAVQEGVVETLDQQRAVLDAVQHVERGLGQRQAGLETREERLAGALVDLAVQQVDEDLVEPEFLRRVAVVDESQSRLTTGLARVVDRVARWADLVRWDDGRPECRDHVVWPVHGHGAAPGTAAVAAPRHELGSRRGQREEPDHRVLRVGLAAVAAAVDAARAARYRPAADDADGQSEGAGLLVRRRRRMGRLPGLGDERRCDLRVAVHEDRALLVVTPARAAPAVELPAGGGMLGERFREAALVRLFARRRTVDHGLAPVTCHMTLALDLDRQVGKRALLNARAGRRADEECDGCSENGDDDPSAHRDSAYYGPLTAPCGSGRRGS